MEQKKQGDAQFKQYEINDPRYDATYVEKTEEAIKARAEKIGANGYDAVTQDNERVQFVKQENEWRKQSDVLAELQEKRRIAEEASRQQSAEAIKRAQENMTQEERDEVQAAREQMGEAQAQPSGPAPLQFTHNGKPATIDLDRFRQTEQGAAEVDPFGPALDEEKAAPQAAEEEADPFGPALDDDKPDAASQPAEGEEEQLNTIEPVIQREAEKGASEAEQLVIDEQTRERLAQQRARDRAEAQAALGHQPQEAEPPKQAKEAEAPGVVNKPFKENNVESDEILTAPKEPVRPVLPPEVEREYVNVGSKYYSQKNPEVEAFEDKGNKLQTRSNSEQVASNLVKIAEARGWDEIKVSGTETFRREVWMEAAARGMEVKGYTPSEQDKASLAAKVKGMSANTVENGKTAEAVKEKTDFRGRENEKGADKAKSIEQQRAESFKKDSREEALKKFPELSGAYAAQAAMNKKMDADGLTQTQKQYAQQKINEKIAKSIETGKIPEVQRRQEVTAKRDKQHHEERELSR